MTIVTLFSFVQADGQDGSVRVPSFERQYADVLDAYFERARGVSEKAIILRVWGGLSPEYEIVLDPETAPKSIAVWTAVKPIWGNAYDLSGPKSTTEEFVSVATKIAVSKRKVPLPEEQLRELWRQALAVDLSLSEHGTFRDSKGREVVILDAPILEMITNGGRTRVQVTDTSGTDVISANPSLLHWAMDLELAAAGKKISP